MTTVPLSLRFLRGHIRLLQGKGVTVHVVASPATMLHEFAADQHVTAHAIDMKRRISPLRDLLALWSLICLLRRLRPDVVHAHTPKAGLLGMLAARIVAVERRFYHIHGLPAETAHGIKRRILHICDAVACRLAHRVFCVSPTLKQAVERDRICCGPKLSVLANGTIDGIDGLKQFNPSRFSELDRTALRRVLNIPEGAAVVGFVGRIVQDKGIRELLEAFGRLESEFPNVYLLVVGSFEHHQPMAPEIVQALTMNPRVCVVGFVEDPASYYSIMDVLVLPSYREGFGLVAAEAAAMEVPVVATRIVGCVDAVRDQLTGILVPPRSASALAGAIAQYLRDPERRCLHGIAGRRRILRDFQPEQVQRALWSYYSRLSEYDETRLLPGTRPKRSFHRDKPTSTVSRRDGGNLGKRLFDIAVAAAVLITFFPLLAAVAVMVRWRLGRPAFFWQQRPGLHGQLFWMPKFRTMTDDRDAAGEFLPDEQRTTQFGRFLRSTSLDELPGLWCVLRGEMSLVGPRPLLAEYLSRYTPEQARRHEVKPGITGWAQVNGRNAISWEEKFQFDLWYVEHQSFSLDIAILFRTIIKVVMRQGIAADSHVTMPQFENLSKSLISHERAA
jgi:lipopolysaccharide/colanic/teichoic acid biosynthesis glycosyltransferase/glycosyltransferase involved in cell wall biosynthesis